MTRSVTSLVLSALLLFSAFISGCGSVGKSAAVRLAEPNANAGSESATPLGRLYPKAKGYVNDFAEILTAAEEEGLESALSTVKQRGKIDFAIAIVRTTGGRDIFDYSLEMANEWRVGSKNGGILLVVSIEDRKWGIQIDKKLEKKFTNDEIKRLGDTMIPHFRQQDYNSGLRVCVKAIADELARRHDFEPVNF